MSWVTVGVVGGTSALGYLNGKEQQRREANNQMANAEQIRQSPWTHMNANIMPSQAQSPYLGAAQGGLSGALMAAQFRKPSPEKETLTPATPQMTSGPDQGFINNRDPQFGSWWDQMNAKKTINT